MNFFFPIILCKNNNLIYYEPKIFRENFLSTAKTYGEMQWVLKYYNKVRFSPKLEEFIFLIMH